MMKIEEQHNKPVYNIKVLGIGSSKYQQLTHNLFTVIKEYDIDVELEQYEEIEDFIRFNLVAIPTLIINGNVVTKGKVPNIEELKSFFLPKTIV